MLVSAVIDKCLLMFADDTTSPTYLSRAEILDFVNTCSKVLVEQLDCFVTRSVIPLVSGSGRYVLPNNLRTLKWVDYDDEVVEASSIRRFVEMDSKWRIRDGKPDYYALDPLQRNYIYLYKRPEDVGDAFYFPEPDGVVIGITDGDLLNFDNQSSLFAVGETVTGGTSGATGEILFVQQNNYSGTLQLKDVTGTFQDNEIIGSSTGSASVNGTLTEQSGDDSWTLTDADGVVVDISGDGADFVFVDEEGDPLVNGVMVGLDGGGGNLIITFSYYPKDLGETDHLPQPYYSGEDIYVPYAMAQMYLVENMEQDWFKAEKYMTEFAMRSSIDLTKIWTPQREFAQQPYSVGSTTPARARLPR